MKISTILDHVDSGHMALPEFQRGYVWNRKQVSGLLHSLYRRYPVGSLLVWATESKSAPARGDAELAPGIVKLLLDGQQRITSLYGIIRGQPPAFFDGNAQSFTNLYFHLGQEEFHFYQPIKMREDPLWIDVSRLFDEGIGPGINRLTTLEGLPETIDVYLNRLNAVHSINEVDFHIDEVTGEDKTIDVVVNIFNRVNSGGTKLSKGDLALAKICAEAPEAREQMTSTLSRWREAGFNLKLDWLLRSVNTIATGEARFEAMHNLSADRFADALGRAEKAIDHLLNAISGRFGLDHDRVFFGRYAMPVMAHYLDRRGRRLDDEKERDKLLFWYLHSAMWGRYSGSTETVINQDLESVRHLDGGLDRLINDLTLWRGNLRVQPDHFAGWSTGARFYPTLYLLTRVGEAKDWGTGLPLTANLLGKLNQLEVHHIFPKALLYDSGFKRPEINAVANFCFLTKDTNLRIGKRPPAEYFEEIESRHPGALASQWVPMDRDLWKIENYGQFLKARRELLAEAANDFLTELLHGEPLPSAEMARLIPAEAAAIPEPLPVGGIDSAEEEAALLACSKWVAERGLPEGELPYELADQMTGQPLAILDLAWPDGLQEEFSQPAAILLDEEPKVLERANAAGFRYFTSIDKFQRYVLDEILGTEEPAEAA